MNNIIQGGYKKTTDSYSQDNKKTTISSEGNLYKDMTNIFDTKGQKYNVKKFMYPEDLDHSLEYGQHMVIFYINVNTKGKTEASSDQSQKFYEIPSEDLNKFSGHRIASGLNQANSGTQGALAAAGAAATVAGIATIVNGAKTVYNNKILAGTGAVAAGAVVAGAGAAASVGVLAASLGAPVIKRLDTAIALHMPNSVKTNYGVEWTSAGTNNSTFKNIDLAMSSMLKTGQNWSNGKDLGEKAVGVGSALVSSGGTAAGVIGLRTIKEAFGDGASKYTEKAIRVTEGNAKEEQTFEGVNFRTFNFNYSFQPKSEEESDNILNIIRMFRFHMLPEYLDELSFMYIYPSEFNIKYYSRGMENQFIERISTCVLTTMEVDYTPNGEFSAFQSSDASMAGRPTHINLSLQFQELSKPSKETSPWNKVGM